MPENLLTLLNYLLLILLYLFFARVLWTVWSEVKSARPAKTAGEATPVAIAPPKPPPAKPGKISKPAKPGKDKRRAGPASHLMVVQPPELAGANYSLADELTVGRAAGCRVPLPNDSYASNVHARAYQADGLTFVEDLGSTNGTFVNGQRITAPTALKVGDRVQIGATILEVA